MKLSAVIFTLSLFTLLSACSEQTPVPATPKPALDAANKAAGLASLNAGQRIYETSCASCHNSGAMGAPKLGDKAAWADHLLDGLDHMVKNAINGVGKMPPKGGNAKLGDHEVKMAVEYIIEKSK